MEQSISTQQWEELNREEYKYLELPIGQYGNPKPELKNETPIQLFLRFFNKEYIDKIVTMTNSYAKTVIEENQEYALKHKFSVLSQWRPTKYEEILRYIALILLCGLNASKSKLCDNWGGDELLSSPIRKIMTFKRYTQLTKFIRFSEETNYKNSKMAKVGDLIEQFNNIAPTIFPYDNHLTIDENLYPFKGRISFKQYIKSKPHKYGLKYFVLASSNSAYVYKIKLYFGKEGIKLKNKNYPHRVVEELITGIEGTRVLSMDSWFTSIELANKLTSIGWGIVAVIAKARLKDNELRKVKVEKNSYLFMQNKEDPSLLLTIMNDKRLFYLLSNCIGVDVESDLSQSTYKPNTVVTYNIMTRGVDRSNQLCSYYRFNNRTKRWTRKVLRYALELVATNCFIVYKMYNPKASHKQFILDVIRDLVI